MFASIQVFSTSTDEAIHYLQRELAALDILVNCSIKDIKSLLQWKPVIWQILFLIRVWKTNSFCKQYPIDPDPCSS